MAAATQERLWRLDNAASRAFLTLVSAAGLSIFSYAAIVVASSELSLNWVLLSLVTLFVVGRTSIRIPKTESTVTLDDTFIYLSVLLYGVWPSVVLAGVIAIVCSLRYPNWRRVAPFNAGAMSLSVFVSSSLVGLVFGNSSDVASDLGRLILAAETLALVHYGLNSSIISVVGALRNRTSVIATWRESFLWVWVSHFAGAVAASSIVELTTVISFYAFVIAIPVLAVTYLTYKNYLEKVNSSIRHVEALSDLHLRTIEALAVAIDAKDEVTHDHVHRVQIYATGLARLFGLSEPEVEALKAGALLHDIGKLAVPDYVLNKPDKLTPAEFEQIKIHTIVGADILSRVQFPYPVVPVVRHHHERWDGRGYPDGLRGEQIPITARILSVVDCFDAVREDRQYRKAMTRDQAIDLIVSGSGTMYDPEVVRLFLLHLPQFEAEIRRQKREVSVSRGKTETKQGLVPARNDAREAVFGQMRNAHREVTTLYEMAQTVGTSLDLRDMFAVLASRLQDIVSYTTCVLYLQKPNSIDVEAVHVSGHNAECLKGASIILGSGVTGWVVANRQPMYNCDPQLDFNAAQIQLDTDYRTVIAVPLLKGDDLLGALTLYSATLNSYKADHLRLVEAVAKLAADAIGAALDDQDAEASGLTDPLTGLANARALRLRFAQEVERARRYGESFAMLMVDLDRVQKAEDGPKADGDASLRQLGGLLMLQMRSEDFLSRYSGDRFIAIVRMEANEARGLAQRLQRAVLSCGFISSGATPFARIYLGWACYSTDGECFDELVLAADRALYADKLRQKAVVSIPEDSSELPSGSCRVM